MPLMLVVNLQIGKLVLERKLRVYFLKNHFSGVASVISPHVLLSLVKNLKPLRLVEVQTGIVCPFLPCLLIMTLWIPSVLVKKVEVESTLPFLSLARDWTIFLTQWEPRQMRII